METKDNVCINDEADLSKMKTGSVMDNSGLTDDMIVFGLESSGYDFSN